MALKKIVEVIFRGQSEKKEKLPGASKENTKKQSLKAWLVFVNFASDSFRGWNKLCWNLKGEFKHKYFNLRQLLRLNFKSLNALEQEFILSVVDH